MSDSAISLRDSVYHAICSILQILVFVQKVLAATMSVASLWLLQTAFFRERQLKIARLIDSLEIAFLS